MTKQEIIDGSKTIAKYLGWKYVPFTPKNKIKSGYWSPANSFVKGLSMHSDGKYWTYVCRKHDQLRFYNNFDSLIPAIEKIESEDLREHYGTWKEPYGDIRSNFRYIEFSRFDGQSSFDIELDLDPSREIGMGKGEGILRDTFKAVVEAINYLNNLQIENI